MLDDAMKELVVFDLMARWQQTNRRSLPRWRSLLNSLLSLVKVAVIFGGAWQQFEKQVLAQLAPGDCLRNLSVLPPAVHSSSNTNLVGSGCIRRTSPQRKS